jgi:hypothetical protein
MEDIMITSVPQLMDEWGCETLEEFYSFAESMAVIEDAQLTLEELFNE